RHERPRLAVRKEADTLIPRHRCCWIAAEVIQFCCADVGMLLRFAIKQQPKYKPDKSLCPGDDECPLPTPIHCDPWHHERRDNRARTRSCIEDSRCQCTFFLRKPFGYAFD